jgi:hypothetical protein
MSVTDASPTDRERELEQENEKLRGQLAAASGPVPFDADEDKRPWKIAADNAQEEHTRAVAPLPYRGPGAVLHHFPHMTGGSGGPQTGPYVRAVAELLNELGYSHNDVIQGKSTFYENTLAGDVARFRRDNDVREQLDAYNGHNDPAQDVVKHLVGPYTVQALFEKVAEKRGQDVASVIGQKEYEIGRAQAHR